MITFSIETITLGEETIEVICKQDEGGTVWYVPKDPGNSDYQAYLAYLAEQESN